MKILQFMLAVTISTLLSLDVLGQAPVQPKQPSAIKSQDSEFIRRLDGDWVIESASFGGTPLPLDQFERLHVDAEGYYTTVQNSSCRFQFVDVDSQAGRIYADHLSREYPRGLQYTILISADLMKIRYRMKGAHERLADDAPDSSAVIQVWKRKPAKQ